MACFNVQNTVKGNMRNAEQHFGVLDFGGCIEFHPIFLQYGQGLF